MRKDEAAPDSLEATYLRQGYLVVPGLVGDDELEELRREADRILDESKARGGARVPLDASERLGELARAGAPSRLAEELLGPAACPVKITIFDKTGRFNWMVPWHQDLMIAVRETRDVEGFGSWSEKEGIPHVQPPAEVLENMVAIRLHLDDTPADNGALRVVPGSHRHGKLDDAAIQKLRDEGGETVCEVPAGGAHVMSPLLLHASSKAEQPGRRRVVHVEYAVGDLPGGLEWA